jgi:DNA-binding transcriptional LysR family regulator
MDLDLRHLNHFVAVVEKGTFGKAADSLGISQPALTKSIHNLEALLQVKLLERRPRGVLPTVYGYVVLARGRSVRVELRELLDDIQALRGGTGGIVRFGVGQGVGSRLVPAATIRLLADHPNNRFSVWTGTPGELVAKLVNGDIEFAVAPLERPSSESRIVEEFLFDDRPVIVVARHHPLARYNLVQPRQLLKYQWVLSRVTTPLRRMLEQIFMLANVPPPIPFVECDSALYVKSLLIERDFVGFLPRDQFRIEETAGLLKGIPLKTKVPARPIGILRRRSEVLSSSGMLLITGIKQICHELGYVDGREKRLSD